MSKIYPFLIPKPPNQQLVVKTDKGHTFFDKLHQHEEIQISHIVKGQGKLFVNDGVYCYHPGDIFIIGSNNAHYFQSTGSNYENHMISLFFNGDSFEKGLLQIPELKEISLFFRNISYSSKLENGTSKIGKLILKISKATEIKKFMLFLKILKKIGTSKTTCLTSSDIQKKVSRYEGHRLRAVLDYTIKNYRKDIRLEHISNLAHLTPGAFCRFFKQRTDKTFFQFLIELRIEYAQQLLLNNADLNISQISEESGFKSISNFNRKFKEHTGLTPSKYCQTVLYRTFANDHPRTTPLPSTTAKHI